MVLAVKDLVAVDLQGNVIPNATVTVRIEGAGAPLAPIYSDREGTTPKSNPFNADENGRITFYAEGGAYRIDVSDGTNVVTYRHVGIGTAQEADIDEFGQTSGTLRWRHLVDISGEDLNDVLVAGFYRGNDLTNAPGGSSDTFYVQVLTDFDATDDVLQMAWSMAGAVFVRTRVSGSWSSWASLPSTATANAWFAQQYFAIATLSAGSGIDWDVSTRQVAKLTLTSNSTFNAPTNVQEGAVYMLIVRQDGTGGHTLSFDSAFQFADVDADINTEANSVTILTFVGDTGNTMYGVVSTNFG